MRPPPNDRRSLWHALSDNGRLSARSIGDATSNVIPGDLLGRSSLGCPLEHLRDRSILLLTRGQLASALTLIELDGIARRIVLYPPGLPETHLRSVIATASVDAIVTDSAAPAFADSGVESISCRSVLVPSDRDRAASVATEWVLLTSGTTGQPKLTVHTFATLTRAITSSPVPDDAPVWSTFYDIRRYGGLQIFLRAMLGGGSMVLSSPNESTAEFLGRAAAGGVTHISGTPSHWRRALMSPLAHHFHPQYVRLSGEIADQAILEHLGNVFPRATIAHAFASTEAGVAFDVRDGSAGFPAKFIGQTGDVELKVIDGTLRIRSPRTALRYLGKDQLAANDGFVDTGDLVELREGRYYFAGRRDGMINVGGAKVHPEEVEAVLNRHPQVRMALVKARKNPFTGAVVVADVVLNSAASGGHDDATATLKRELIAACREVLAEYKVPAAIHFVPSLNVTDSGKLARLNG
jgi:acyl-coenzyme A synthetase/AMP-(fatty) acid ligase